jgi:hypothetical protein
MKVTKVMNPISDAAATRLIKVMRKRARVARVRSRTQRSAVLAAASR